MICMEIDFVFNQRRDAYMLIWKLAISLRCYSASAIVCFSYYSACQQPDAVRLF